MANGAQSRPPDGLRPAPRWLRVAVGGVLVIGAFVAGGTSVQIVSWGTAWAMVVWAVILAFAVLGVTATRKRTELVAGAGMFGTPILAVVIAAPGFVFSQLWSVRLAIGIAVLACALAAILLRPLWRRRPRWQSVHFHPRVLTALALLGAVPGVALGIAQTADAPARRFRILESALTPVQATGEADRAMQVISDDRRVRGDGAVGKLAAGPEDGSGASSPEWTAASRALLQERADALRAAQAIAAAGRLSVPVVQDPIEEMHSALPGDVRWAGKLLLVQCRLRLAEGRLADALRGALDAEGLGLAAASAGESTMLCLSGLGVVDNALAQVRSAAASEHATADELRPVVARLDLTDAMDRATIRMLASEFNFFGLSLQRTARMEGLEGAFGPQEYRLFRIFFRKLPLLKVNSALNTAGRYLEAAATEIGRYRQRDAVHEIYGPGNPSEALGFFVYHAANPLGDVLVMMNMSDDDRLVVGHFSHLATARLTQLYVALRCYQLEHGKLPDALDALAPEYLKALPLDPFTGKPFGYEPGGQKPRIWSVGPDQKTDPPEAENGDDVVVDLGFAAPPAAK